MNRLGAALVLGMLASACEPQLVVGTLMCEEVETTEAPSVESPVAVPWTTGFEAGFCDFARAGGFCYGDVDASYEIVGAPVHGGARAAAFSVTSDPSKDGEQARCVVQGALPLEASYAAWLYLPAPAHNNMANWNLMHFQGGSPDAWHGLWDVSLDTADDGSLFLYVLDVLGGSFQVPDPAPPVPIGSWFHVEFRLRRAKDATGEVALYQDGALLVEVSGLVTDDSDLGQWYVGNLADALTPTDYTLYVDDVAIRTP